MTEMYELSDVELDAVSGGARQSGLVNVAVEDSLNDVNIGVAAQALTVQGRCSGRPNATTVPSGRNAGRGNTQPVLGVSLL